MAEVELDRQQDNSELKEAIDQLTKVVSELITIFKTASADIHTEADADLGKKLDVLIKQNYDIAKALTLLLDLQNEHLPRIAKMSEKASPRRLISSPMHRVQPNINTPSSGQQGSEFPFEDLPEFPDVKRDE